MPFKHQCTTHVFFTERLSNHCQGLCGTFSEICTKHDVLSLLDPLRKLIRPGTRLKIKGCKNRYLHPAAWNVIQWLPRHASTNIYRCIVLLKLPYRWKRQPRKLWISVFTRARHAHTQKTMYEICFIVYGLFNHAFDRLCGLVVRVLDYRSGGPGSISGTTRFSEKKKEKRKENSSGSGTGSTQPREYNWGATW
jgi:hypothetical protein